MAKSDKEGVVVAIPEALQKLTPEQKAELSKALHLNLVSILRSKELPAVFDISIINTIHTAAGSKKPYAGKKASKSAKGAGKAASKASHK
jgi:hypothetical protein